MNLQLLDPDAAAELLGCTVATVEDRLRDGTLPGLQIGRSWRIPAAALDQRLTELALEQSAERRRQLCTTLPTASVPHVTDHGDGRKTLSHRRVPAPIFS